MNRMVRVCVALGCATVFATLEAFCQSAANEPIYQGRSLDAWLHDLFSPSTRDKATVAISQMKPSPVPILVERLNDRGWERAAAFQGLIALGPAAQSAIPDLAKMISDPLSGEAEPAIKILSRIGGEAAPVLIEALKKVPLTNSNMNKFSRMGVEFKRGTLEMAIGELSPPAHAAIPIFLEDLKNEDSTARNCAVLALSGMALKDAEAASILVTCLKDPDETTRGNAALGLRDWHRTGWSLLKPRDFDPLTNAVKLSPANPVAVAALRHMANYDSVGNNRWAAIDSLMSIDPQGSLEEFVKNLQSADLAIRRSSAWNLNYFKKGARSAIPALIKCMSDQDAGVRQNSAVALREIGEQPDIVVPVLLQTLSHDPDLRTREMAAVALGAFGGAAKAAVTNIIDILKNTTNEISGEGLFNALYDIDPKAAERLQKEHHKDFDPVEMTKPVETITPNEVR
jgi:HEAT repeat protein